MPEKAKGVDIVKKKIFVTAVAILLLSSPVTVLADNVSETLDGNDSTVVYIRSDGENTSTTTQSGDTTNNSSSQSSRQLTQAEQNAVSKKSDIRSELAKWKQKAMNSADYNSRFYLTNYNAVNAAFTKISASEANRMAELVRELKEQSTDEAEWVNRNYPPGIGGTDSSSDLKNMSQKEKKEAEKEIIRNEIGDAEYLYEENRVSQWKPEDNETGSDFTITVTPIHILIKNDNSGSNTYEQNGNNTRTDMMPGYPTMKDTTTYTDRFNPIISEVEDNHWNDSSSVSLNDSITVTLITDYHLYSAKKDYVTHTDFLSDERRWTITKDGVSLGDPVITDDPRHELNFTDVYKDNGPGVYHIIAEQLANVQRATYVQYDKGEYLYETNTGALLWYNEETVRGSGGGSILLNIKTSQEWVETGDTFDLTINDLSDIETEGSATEREE